MHENTRAALLATHLGRPMPENARAALLATHLGSHPSTATRAKQSTASSKRVGSQSGGWRGGKVEYVCVYCGQKSFEYPSEHKTYCNNACRYAAQKEKVGPLSPGWKGGKVEQTCPQSGKKFFARPSEHKTYYDPECFYAAIKGKTRHPLSDKARREISLARIEWCSQPENAARMSVALTKALADPEVRTKISLARIEWYTHLENRVQQSAAMTEWYNLHPEARTQASAATKAQILSLDPRVCETCGKEYQPTSMFQKYCPECWPLIRAMATAKNDASRRDLGFIPLNLWFPGSEGDHLSDGEHVIYMPRWMHRSIYHNHNTGQGMAEMDALALAYAGLPADVLDDTLPFD
jgi:hypothetical protein